MVKSGESEREAAARSDELFEDGDIVAAGGKNHSEIRIKQKKSWVPVVFILPALAFLILFNYVPMYGILIAFQDYVPGDDFLLQTRYGSVGKIFPCFSAQRIFGN